MLTNVLSSLNISDIVIAVVVGWFAFIQTKKSKEPDQAKVLMDKYDSLYGLIEKQRDSYIKLNVELQNKVDRQEIEQRIMRNIIFDLTGVTYEQYVVNKEKSELEGGEN